MGQSASKPPCCCTNHVPQVKGGAQQPQTQRAQLRPVQVAQIRAKARPRVRGAQAQTEPRQTAPRRQPPFPTESAKATSTQAAFKPAAPVSDPPKPAKPHPFAQEPPVRLSPRKPTAKQASSYQQEPIMIPSDDESWDSATEPPPSPRPQPSTKPHTHSANTDSSNNHNTKARRSKGRNAPPPAKPKKWKPYRRSSHDKGRPTAAKVQRDLAALEAKENDHDYVPSDGPVAAIEPARKRSRNRKNQASRADPPTTSADQPRKRKVVEPSEETPQASKRPRRDDPDDDMPDSASVPT